MKSKLIISTLVFSLLVPSILSTQAADEVTSTSKITGNVTTGGMSLSAGDANLGDTKIGTKINDVSSNIEVKDWTGGKGWALFVKSSNFDDINKTYRESVQIDGFNKTAITKDNSFVAEGDSKKTPYSLGATYSAEWGETPRLGDNVNNLVWTLTPALPKEISGIVVPPQVATNKSVNIYDGTTYDLAENFGAGENVQTVRASNSWGFTRAPIEFTGTGDLHVDLYSSLRTVTHEKNSQIEYIYDDEYYWEVDEYVDLMMRNLAESKVTMGASELELLINKSSKDEVASLTRNGVSHPFTYEQNTSFLEREGDLIKFKIPEVTTNEFATNRIHEERWWSDKEMREGFTNTAKQTIYATEQTVPSTRIDIVFNTPDEYVLTMKSGRQIKITVDRTVKTKTVSKASKYKTPGPWDK